MRLQLRKPAQALNKAYAKQSISQERIDVFRQALARLFARLDETESEEHQKNIVAGFLNESFYGPGGPSGHFEINTRERVDLVIHTGPTSQALPGVLIEAKKVFAGEMMTTLKNNVKSLHELILYYFEERERHQNIAVSHLIITDVYNWFIIDENDFRHFFYDNARLRKLYQVKKQQHKDSPFFYAETARILRDMDDELPVTCLNLREIATLARSNDPNDLRRLIPVYKLFSPEHLLKLPFANDANTLNRSFYNELLHIVGLHETAADGVKLIERLPEGARLEGSLLENTINVLRVDNALADLVATDKLALTNYGRSEAEQLFGIALELCITWLNRILFLKLLEGQLMRYHGQNSQNGREVQFLTPRHIREFDELSELFFEVLAVPEANRPAGIVTRYGAVPYLNSSLFELTDLERKVLKIKALKDRLELPLFEHTALKTPHGKRQTGQLPALQYLLAFLDAYDFSSEGPAEIQPDNKPLINAAVLGLIFEKLNGYRDGSFFTPGFVTMYMVRDLIRRAVLTRFNEQFGWQCTDITALYNQLNRVALAEANAVMNSLRVVDPAVGSGHFLVSALNEIIALKAELGILTDRDGRRLRQYEVTIVNDELVITDEDGEVFQYRAAGGRSESQRIQETIFHEKQAIIENCLFGVDLNPNSINICRLRLWIELLKSAYYHVETHGFTSLQTLPNLDINLKVGNSLVGRFGLGFRIDTLRNLNMREKFLRAFGQYGVDVMAYKECRDKVEKDRIRGRIAQFQAFVQQVAMVDQKEYAEIQQLKAKLAESAMTFDFFNQDDRLQSSQEQLAAKQALFDEKQRVYRQAFEWRFAFPEVLDEAGNYVGFDVVLGNPPYIRQEELGEYKALFSKAFPNTYAGTADLYVMFIEQGMSLLRPGGQFGYIIPNKWMRAGYGLNLRKWLKTIAIEQITDFGDLPVFSEATTYPCLLMLRRANATDSLRAVQVDTLKFGKAGLIGYLHDRTFAVPTESLQDSGWVLSDATVQNLLTKLKQTGQPLKAYVDNKIFRGILTGLNEAFVIDAKTRDQLIADDPRSAEVIKPFLAGRDIKRYQSPEATKFLIFARRGIHIENYPAVLSYLEQFKEKLMPKPKGYEGKWSGRKEGSYKWYEIQDAVDYYEEFEKPHIMYQEIATYQSFGWNPGGIYSNNKVFILPNTSSFMLGILNSKVVWFYLNYTASKLQGGALALQGIYVNTIPIPSAIPAQKAPIVALVEEILTLKAADRTTDTTALEAEIDLLVYGLYGLSAEEIAVIAPCPE